MKVNLLLKTVQIYLLFLVLILSGLLLPVNAFFLRVNKVRIWRLSLICFRWIPQRIWLKNLLQLQRLVEKLILSLLLVRLGCIMMCDMCGKVRVRVVALLCASPLF